MMVLYLRTAVLSLLLFLSLVTDSLLWASILPEKGEVIQSRLDDLSLFLGMSKIMGAEVNEKDLPAPFNYLLQQPLMTLGIEKYYQRAPIIQVIHEEINQKDNTYSRAVYLLLDKNKKKGIGGELDQIIAVLAFITINFNELPHTAIANVLHSTIPFGKILINHKINTTSTDKAYFAVNCTPDLVKRIHCKLDALVYGRVNTLVKKDNGQWLAKVVEILPVIEGLSAS